MRIVDMHCDTISELLVRRDAVMGQCDARQHSGDEGGAGLQGGGQRIQFEGLRENSGHVDLQKLRKSGYLLQNFALYVDKMNCADPWEKVQELYGVYVAELEQNQDLMAPVYCFEDVGKNESKGLISALLTVEEGGVCKGEISKLCKLYEQGVRMMTLTWNYPNEIGFPNLNTPDTEKGLTDKGLTKKGFEFVAKMEELGMIVDVSHLSDAGFYDVLSCTTKPFVASHSNARAICPHVRNMTDDMIRKLAERGGVMGLNFCADFLKQLPAGVHNPGTISAMVDHAKHIVKVGGIEVLGLGSDFDGIPTHAELPHAGKMHLLYDALRKGGFSERELDKIFSENVLRVYKEVLG